MGDKKREVKEEFKAKNEDFGIGKMDLNEKKEVKSFSERMYDHNLKILKGIKGIERIGESKKRKI